ncbi:glycosyltransferase [Hymenobacter fodinae]|nr:glycosyltransferase [Hymenobacter fodinae]
METGVSIIVCCYNSVPRLPATLRHLAGQIVSKHIPWEVVVVNNNSSDDTASVANKEWEKYNIPVPFKVVEESTPGLSHAREAGMRNSTQELIIFCDDDNWLEPDYVQNAVDIMAANHSIGILGGLNTPIADVEIPSWFHNFSDGYACGPQAAQDGPVDPNRLYITGAGMVIRRKIFAELDAFGFKSQMLDRKGEELSSGGDTELCFATAILGYELYYSSKLRLFHYMDEKRLTWSYLIKLYKGHMKSYYKLLFYKRIYHGTPLNKSWTKETIDRIKKESANNAFAMVYHSYVKDKTTVKDVYNIERINEMEVWKAHFNARNEYKKLISYFCKIEEAAKRKKEENRW